MADWKTYAKAARNTARRQAPGAKDAARRASDRAGDYARAAGKAVDGGRRSDEAPRRTTSDDSGSPTSSPSSSTTSAPRPAVDGAHLRKEAAAYYTVASRRMTAANIGPRIMRSLRDALLIGLSLFVIWAVLAAAGIPIPFTTVLIIVGLIVVVSFGTGLYAQWHRSRDALENTEDPRER
ncbi:hypothetical protein [Brachybacterium sp.]|uniref:hypothetical protein n=1 Tax=Brachybacterium sp. TaxID=1891286 RepID=UPI002ED1EF34